MAMSGAEQNALVVSYETQGSTVKLDMDFVKKYLVSGDAARVTDQEVLFYMNTCKALKLNPMVSGESYLIKYGDRPAQLVVGKTAYLKRAFKNPNYLYKRDGVVVERGSEYVKKQGCALYPGETLIAGWCEVFYKRNGETVSEYREVSLSEYNQGQANWKSKPVTMLNKTAISQCLREAFPDDYEGLYSEDELIASGVIPPDGDAPSVSDYEDVPYTEIVDDDVVSTDQRKQLFSTAKAHLGDDGVLKLQEIVKEVTGNESTDGMRISQYKEVLKRVMVAAVTPDAEEASD